MRREAATWPAGRSIAPTFFRPAMPVPRAAGERGYLRPRLESAQPATAHPGHAVPVPRGHVRHRIRRARAPNITIVRAFKTALDKHCAVGNA